ncbi:CpaF family protein [Burkholderia gladioli]|uniref:CpaF family protein n=1 Tax=Burkholderia gladioli TaxID=28095 RepID=UPI001641A4D0|nr:ATPase, T2SS/T4P/T4SS family [Burkholderia gladioli]
MFTVHNSENDERVFRGHLNPIAHLLDDPSVIEILINHPKRAFVERHGEMTQIELDLLPQNVSGAAMALAAINQKDHHPVLDCRMPNLRVAMAMPPIAVHGPAMAIRKHRKTVRRLRQYLDEGLFQPGIQRPLSRSERGATPDISAGNEAVFDFLRHVMITKENLLVAGSTSAGKTALLNALEAEIPDEERLIVIEDTKELILNRPNFLQLEANLDRGISIADLLRLALRMRPDRIVVGEVRDGTAYFLMDALNTGHSGSGGTLHADSAPDALIRLESLLRQAPQSANWPLAAMRAQIASTFRYVIFSSKIAGRAPETILEILGLDERGEYRLKTLYQRFSDD